MAEGTTTNVYTYDEIKNHNNSRSTWVVIDNKVYDVTKFLDEHPGGEEVLLEQAGQNATDAFEDVGHSKDARELRDQYYIGDLHPNEQTTSTQKPQVSATEPEASTPWSGWLIPLAIGVAAVLLYKFFLAPSSQEQQK